MLHTFRGEVTRYLEETTIHGLRYLSHGRNYLEKFVWFVVIVASLSIATYLIAVNIHETYADPILTTIDTTSVKNVPFPAITVRGDYDFNPWGGVSKALNMLTFYDTQQQDVFERSKQLRHDFIFIFKAIFETMGTEIRMQLSSFTLAEVKKYGQSLDSGARAYEKISTLAEYFAAVAMKNESIRSDIERSITEAFTDGFFKYPSYYMANHWTTEVETIMKNYTEKLEFNQELTTCKNEEITCIAHLKSAYITLYIPYEINKFPYHSLGFGHYVSYFSRLITRSNQGHFLGTVKLSPNEHVIRDYLAQVLDNLAGKSMGGMSLFELVNTVEKTGLGDDNFAPTLQSKYGCRYGDTNLKQYIDNWEAISEGRSTNTVLHSKDHPKDYYSLQPPCQNMTHAKKEEFDACCAIPNIIKNSLIPVLKVMKYAQQPPVFSETMEEINATFGNLDILGFNNVGNIKNEVDPYILTDYNPRIFMCKYAGVPVKMRADLCNLFHRSPTDEGIGYTFNNANFWDVYSRSEYNEIFASIMFPKGYNLSASPSDNDDSDESQRWVYPKKGVVFPKTSGPAYALTAVLQGIRIFEPNPAKEDIKPYNTFKVSIHDPLSIADLRSSGVDVEVGYVSTFLISPSQIVTSPNAQGISEERRQCRFQHERKGMKLFKAYTHSGCIFECQLNDALSKCGCIPWDYPHPGNLEPVCDRWGKECFEIRMGNTETVEKCDCPYDCATTRYSYSVSSTALDVEAMCNRDSFYQDELSGYLTSFPPMFIRRYEQVVRGYDIGEEAICKKNLKGIAIVKFQLANQIITRIRKTERVTFSDQLSNIGNKSQFATVCIDHN
jgi:hypothetical protein